MGAVSTPKLDLLRVQETWQFADDAFNRFIDDADNKLVGVSHLNSPKHWREWKPNTAYEKDDVVRITNTKSHQYYQCIISGTSGLEEPVNNVTGSQIEDGTVVWVIMSLSETDVTGGALQIWLSGGYYYRGDAVLYGTALYRCKVDHTATNWLNDYIYWQEVCASIRMWQPIIYYFVDDTVVANGLIYKCITAHRSSASFNDTEESNWELIGGTGGATNWVTNTRYQLGQLVIVNGILYRANQKHISGIDFQTDLSKWDIIDANIKDWEQEIYYPEGTLVNYLGMMYKCIVAHTATTNFYDDRQNWVLFHNPIVVWQSNNYFEKGQVAEHNNCLYRCNTSHSTFSTTVKLYPLRWETNKEYNIGDSIVIAEETVDITSGNTVTTESLYRCKIAHTSTEFINDITNWMCIKDLSEGDITWTSNTEYAPSDIVRYGGVVFECTSYHISSNSFLEDISYWGTETIIVDSFELNQDKWDIIYSSIQLWRKGVFYKVGTTVIYQHSLFRCTVGHRSLNWDADYSKWESIGDGSVGGASTWEVDTPYNQSQLVVYNGILYRAKSSFVSGDTFEEDIDKWEMVNANISHWATESYYPVGCLVQYDNVIYKCNTSHTSTNFSSDIEYWNAFNTPTATLKNWSTNTKYENGQCVLYVGTILKCNTTHISNSNSIINDKNYWEIIYASVIEWTPNTMYKVGNVVIDNNKLYRCVRDHISSDLGLQTAKVHQSQGNFWLDTNYPVLEYDYDIDLGRNMNIMRLVNSTGSNGNEYVVRIDYFISDDGVNFTNIGSNSTPGGWKYADNITLNTNVNAQYVKFRFIVADEEGVGRLYACNIRVYAHTDDFVLIGTKEGSINTWSVDTLYYSGDIILYNNSLYRCIKDHYSADFEQERKYWQAILSDIVDWKISTDYIVGQYVRYNKKLYRCNTTHTSSAVNFLADIDKWDSTASNLMAWVAEESYNVGDVVIRDNKIYKCIVANNSQTFVASEWEEISNSANASIGQWKSETHYVVGDYVENNAQLYRCNTTHDSVAWKSELANWDLISGLQIWQANTPYKANSVVFYDGILYKVNISFTSGTVFDATNLEKIGGVGGAVTWQPNTDYSANQLIIHDKLLYRAKIDFTSSETFNNINLEQITMGWTAYWQPSTYYAVGETVIQSTSIIRCAVAHTSSRVYNTAEAENWVIVASAQAIITYWTPNTEYTSGNAVIHNDILYICNITHTSSQDFVDDMIIGHEKWRTINTSATSGSWEQVTKLDVVAPKIVEVIIHNTSTFCLAPVEVLKFIQGTQDVMVNEFTFDAGDGQKFTVDGVRADTNKYVIFDGQVKLQTEYVYPMTVDTQTENGYIQISDEIDLSQFKDGEDLVVR